MEGARRTPECAGGGSLALRERKRSPLPRLFLLEGLREVGRPRVAGGRGALGAVAALPWGRSLWCCWQPSGEMAPSSSDLQRSGVTLGSAGCRGGDGGLPHGSGPSGSVRKAAEGAGGPGAGLAPKRGGGWV